MLEVALASINSFAYIEGKADSSVQPSEDLLITLTYGQLRKLIEGAIRPLQEELQDLRVRQDALESRISEPPAQQATETEIVAFRSILADRDEELHQIRRELDRLEENTARERAYDRQRLTRLENPEPEISNKTQDHIEDLVKTLKSKRIPSLSIADAAKWLGLSKPGMHHLLPHIQRDPRLEVSKDPHHKQKFLIHLRRFA